MLAECPSAHEAVAAEDIMSVVSSGPITSAVSSGPISYSMHIPLVMQMDPLAAVAVTASLSVPQELQSDQPKHALISLDMVIGSYLELYHGIYKSAWEALRRHNPQVEWAGLLWNKHHISWCSVISWLAYRNKPTTKDRLVRCGVVFDARCQLCGVENEDRDHLFFACDYSRQNWNKVLVKCNQPYRYQNWKEEIHAAMDIFKGNNLAAKMRRLSFTVAVYCVWQERNQIVFAGCGKSSQRVVLVFVRFECIGLAELFCFVPGTRVRAAKTRAGGDGGGGSEVVPWLEETSGQRCESENEGFEM
ncbi:hypothetical protein LguiA_029103 [Lonicera macranthoides]